MGKIWYEPHPCAPERAQELWDAGYQIIDAAFAPADWSAPDGLQTEAEAPAPVKRGRPRKASL
jgi:hypothetical protein